MGFEDDKQATKAYLIQEKLTYSKVLEDASREYKNLVDSKFFFASHNMENLAIPGTDQPYSCDFDKYVKLDNYAVATLEVIGSHLYLNDERLKAYPNQDEVDPLVGRLPLFLNVKDCALDWIGQSAAKASASDKKAVFFLFHASFYSSGEFKAAGDAAGEFYNRKNLKNYTKLLTDEEIERPFQPLFDKLTETAFSYPDLMFYVVHSDAHRFSTVRMNPG